MQAAKKAVETIKETAANIGASAKSGLEKTKATLQEKTEMMSAHDQNQKDMATQKKGEKINQAEKEKQQARENNAAGKQSALAGHMGEAHYTETGPGNETATYDTTGPRPETTSNHSTAGPGPESATYYTPGPATATTYSTPGPGTEIATFPTTGPGPETTPHPTGEYGQHLGTATVHGHGLGHGGLTGDVVGSRPVETNTGVDSTAHITHVGGTAPASGPNIS